MSETHGAVGPTDDARAWWSWMQREGMQRLRELAMRCWDPIGVADVPEARDEYDSYLPHIAAALRDGDSPEVLASYLSSIRTDEIGLDPAPLEDRAAAAAFIAWHAAAWVPKSSNRRHRQSGGRLGT